MTMMIRTLFGLLLGAALAVPAELPVTQVVLYKHGLGFFERAGTLGPGESARLDFDAAEMNDVLKSLTIDVRGGKISGLRYDSMDPLSHTLAQFPFQIGGAQPLSGILDRRDGDRRDRQCARNSGRRESAGIGTVDAAARFGRAAQPVP
jgi:hypothetical protein